MLIFGLVSLLTILVLTALIAVLALSGVSDVSRMEQSLEYARSGLEIVLDPPRPHLAQRWLNSFVDDYRANVTKENVSSDDEFSVIKEPRNVAAVIADAQGVLIAVQSIRPNSRLPLPGASLTTAWPWTARALGTASLSHKEEVSQGVQKLSRVSRIQSSEGRTLGYLYVQMDLGDEITITNLRLGLLFPFLLAAVLFAAVSGWACGLVGSNDLKRRLRQLRSESVFWARGELTIGSFPLKERGDEIDDLHQALRKMALELHDHIQTKEALATSQERTRIARDLHDNIKQQAFALSLELASAQVLAQRGETPLDQMKVATQVAAELQQGLGELITGLTEKTNQDELFLGSRLREFATLWAQRFSLELCLDISPELENHPVGPAMLQELESIVREGLANVQRHAHSTQVRFRLFRDKPQEIAMELIDRGCGGARARSGSHGLRSMGERIRTLGGRLGIESPPSGGTTLRLVFPEEIP